MSDAGKSVFQEGAIADLRQKMIKLYSDHANVKKISREDYQRQAWQMILQLEKLTTLSEAELQLKNQLLTKSTGDAIGSSDQIDDNVAQDIANFAK